MRKTLSILALVVCGGLWGASQARADSICDGTPGNLVANCSFDTGDFSGWTLSGNTANPGNNYYGVDTFDATSDTTFGAYLSQDSMVSENPLDLSQTLTTVVGGTYDIVFYLDQDTAPYTGYTHSATVTWGSTTILSLTPTVSTPGAFGLPPGGYVEYTFMEPATSTSTTLQFAMVNDDNYWSLDDVSVAQTPEPPTSVLLVTALGGLLLLRCRPRQSRWQGVA